MATYKTAEVAAMIGVHPNTVRLYEKMKLIPKPERLSNGYRVFTDFHIWQCKLIRLAFQVEVLQNGLRKKIVRMVTVSALTSMIKKLVDQGLVTIEQSDQDKRKKFVVLTELGWAQKEIGDRVSKELGEIFYQGFSDQEIREFEDFQERIISNLKAKENDI